MNERENMAAGIYAALSAVLVLLCLIGAFILPSSVVNSKWLGIFAFGGFLFGLPLLLRFAHRSRIRDAVAKIDGTILRIKKLPFWSQPNYQFFLGVKYRVEYLDTLGATHRAICNSGFFQGIEWLEDIVTDVKDHTSVFGE